MVKSKAETAHSSARDARTVPTIRMVVGLLGCLLNCCFGAGVS